MFLKTNTYCRREATTSAVHTKKPTPFAIYGKQTTETSSPQHRHVPVHVPVPTTMPVTVSPTVVTPPTPRVRLSASGRPMRKTGINGNLARKERARKSSALGRRLCEDMATSDDKYTKKGTLRKEYLGM